jgi:hypothetical protein
MAKDLLPLLSGTLKQWRRICCHCFQEPLSSGKGFVAIALRRNLKMVKNLLPGGSKCTQKKIHMKLVSGMGE